MLALRNGHSVMVWWTPPKFKGTRKNPNGLLDITIVYRILPSKTNHTKRDKSIGPAFQFLQRMMRMDGKRIRSCGGLRMSPITVPMPMLLVKVQARGGITLLTLTMRQLLMEAGQRRKKRRTGGQGRRMRTPFRKRTIRRRRRKRGASLPHEILILILATVKMHQNFLKMQKGDFMVDRAAEGSLRDMGTVKRRLFRVEMISSLTSSEERNIVVYSRLCLLREALHLDFS